MNILFVCSRLDTMVAKRGIVLQKLAANGHKVTLLSMERHQETERVLEGMGVGFRCFKNERNRISLWADFLFVLNLAKLLLSKRYDCLVSYTIKPNVYSGIACFFVARGIRFYPFVTGLGYAFQSGGFKRYLLKKVSLFLHRISFFSARKVIFQNYVNRDYFVDTSVVKKDKTEVILGDGVDVSISPTPYLNRVTSGFVCVARVLGEKGLRELHESILQVKRDEPSFNVQLYGPLESSPDAISAAEVAEWKKMGTIIWNGYSSNVSELLNGAACFVLPSYHEGMSTAVAEAMAAGLPIIGTDIPGIRELVEDNGFLVPVKDPVSLSGALLRFINLPDEEKNEMSKISRERSVMMCDRKVIMDRIYEMVIKA